MTGTVDIQEMKRRALAAKEAGLTHPASLKELHALNALGAIASPSTILALIEAVKRQGEALEWYETHVRDCRKITKDGDAARHALDKDGGERARAALKEKSDV